MWELYNCARAWANLTHVQVGLCACHVLAPSCDTFLLIMQGHHSSVVGPWHACHAISPCESLHLSICPWRLHFG